jgi:hypothetical protein
VLDVGGWEKSVARPRDLQLLQHGQL